MDEWTDEWMDERMNEQTNEGTNERTKEWMNGRTHEYISGRMNEGTKEISAIDRVRLCTEVKTARHACPALAARNTIHIFFSFLLRMHVIFVLKIKRRIKLEVGKVYLYRWVGWKETSIRRNKLYFSTKTRKRRTKGNGTNEPRSKSNCVFDWRHR